MARRPAPWERHGGVNMERMAFKVKGMSCPSCERILEMELVGLPGVGAVRADYRNKTVGIDGDGMDSDMVKRAIRESGYRVI